MLTHPKGFVAITERMSFRIHHAEFLQAVIHKSLSSLTCGKTESQLRIPQVPKIIRMYRVRKIKSGGLTSKSSDVCLRFSVFLAAALGFTAGSGSTVRLGLDRVRRLVMRGCKRRRISGRDGSARDTSEACNPGGERDEGRCRLVGEHWGRSSCRRNWGMG